MKYLGETIHTMIHTGYRGRLFEYETLECTFDTVDDAKQHIRKQILPLYQPTKTLKWLEEKTGDEWCFSCITRKLNAHDTQWGRVPVYDFSDNTVYCINDKIKVSPGGRGTWVDMTPREFIEKIARGELI